MEDKMSKEDETNKPVLSYTLGVDKKGRPEWKPTYLKDTPDEEIERLNKLFNEHKKHKQK